MKNNNLCVYVRDWVNLIRILIIYYYGSGTISLKGMAMVVECSHLTSSGL